MILPSGFFTSIFMSVSVKVRTVGRPPLSLPSQWPTMPVFSAQPASNKHAQINKRARKIIERIVYSNRFRMSLQHAGRGLLGRRVFRSSGHLLTCLHAYVLTCL